MFDAGPIRTIFGKHQHFDGVLANPLLNALGLHLGRIALSDAVLRLRRAQLAGAASEDEREYRERGVVTIADFLDAGTFGRVLAEVRAVVGDAATRVPRPSESDERGFGTRRPFDGGVDRFDGNTLNRFLSLSTERTPATLAALGSGRLARLAAFASGFHFDPTRFSIYETVNGDDASNPDIQRSLHRDTFHSTVKVWLFLDEVRLDDGPFGYVVGSHRMDVRRLRWEHRRARAACGPEGERDGSFRASPAELDELGLPPPTPFVVPANTLVLADVRGLHRRGDALPGTRRLALYANLRAEPFRPSPT